MSQDSEKKSVDRSRVWRESRVLIWSHRRSLAIGMTLMVVNRLAGLVLPASSGLLIDDVIGNGRVDLLRTLAVAVGLATLLQAGTSFGLSQVVSVAAQRVAAVLRRSWKLRPFPKRSPRRLRTLRTNRANESSCERIIRRVAGSPDC